VWLQQFFGGVDEAWFRLVHVAIEAAAAPAVGALKPLQAAAEQVRLFFWGGLCVLRAGEERGNLSARFADQSWHQHGVYR
jgi:hypothetical protein